jgi:RND family efflux transporter MFP subunit
MVGVKSGDAVRTGQILMRIDPRSVDQGAVAGDAQVALARATLDVARKDLDRQRQLFQSGFISQAGLDGAEAQFKAAQAQVTAQLAQTGVAHTQSGFALVTAPYGGVVSDVPVSLGDMALPGRPLLTMYDPTAMRVSAALPESAANLIASASPSADTVMLEFAGTGASVWIKPARSQVLPAADPATHTMTVRLDIANSGKVPGQARLAPGMFARVWLRSASPAPGAAVGEVTPRMRVPASAIVRRAELHAVYVVDAQGRPHLRQVRLGHVDAGRPDASLVEVLSGLSAGEQVALEPQAAARMP